MLRCVYHGDKFDIHGTCLDVPCVPPGSNLKDQVRAKSYPCIERGDLVLTYMAVPAHKPAFPDLEWALVPSAQRFSTRHIQESQWLQGFQGAFDAGYLSFLHSRQVDMRRERTDHDRRIVPTKYEVMHLDFGFALAGGRELENGNTSWHVDVMLFPFHKIIPSAPPGAYIWGADCVKAARANDHLIEQHACAGGDQLGDRARRTQDRPCRHCPAEGYRVKCDGRDIGAPS